MRLSSKFLNLILFSHYNSDSSKLNDFLLKKLESIRWRSIKQISLLNSNSDNLPFLLSCLTFGAFNHFLLKLWLGEMDGSLFKQTLALVEAEKLVVIELVSHSKV